ncbi:hypothetical protein GCM10027615_14800 [Plantactinospora veratri]
MAVSNQAMVAGDGPSDREEAGAAWRKAHQTGWRWSRADGTGRPDRSTGGTGRDAGSG